MALHDQLFLLEQKSFETKLVFLIAQDLFQQGLLLKLEYHKHALEHLHKKKAAVMHLVHYLFNTLRRRKRRQAATCGFHRHLCFFYKAAPRIPVTSSSLITAPSLPPTALKSIENET